MQTKEEQSKRCLFLLFLFALISGFINKPQRSCNKKGEVVQKWLLSIF